MGWIVAFVMFFLGVAAVYIAATGSQATVWKALVGGAGVGSILQGQAPGQKLNTTNPSAPIFTAPSGQPISGTIGGAVG